jgi:D-alanine-D-alanine ligase
MAKAKSSKTRVGVLFGGRSGEHEVSLLSAASVIQAIDKRKYEVVPIGITKEGHWLTSSHAEQLLGGNAKGDKGPDKSVPESKHLRAGDPAATPGAAVLASGESVLVPPEPLEGKIAPFHTESDSENAELEPVAVDVIFPVLHGTFGEDGTIQGLLELADLPYVGAGVLGSAAGMDKDVMKTLFRAAGLPLVKHVTVLRREWQSSPKTVRKRIEAALKYPLFVKPANLGSSVGISKAHDKSELPAAMDEAAKYDRKIIVEQGVGGKRKARELECAVLGNDDPKASIVGEVVPIREFYDYSAKYLDEGSELIIPAKLPKSVQKKVQQMAVTAFKAVDCSGLGRVDFLMDPASERIYVNEINTMPGFTSISMYPKLWGASGIEYPELIDRLVQLGMERFAEKKKNQYSREGK